MSVSFSKEKNILIKNEIRMAEKLNEQELAPIISEAISRYMGRHIPRQVDNWDVILNEIYPIVQFNLPAIFFRNPRVFLKPRNKTFIAKRRDPLTGRMAEIELDSGKSARTQEAILNYILSEIKYKRETRRVLLDALLLPYGVMWHGYKGEFGMTDEQSFYIRNESLFVKRINPMRFLKDPSVTIANIDEARWVGRSFDIPLEELLEADDLDVDRKEIKGEIGFGQRIGTKKAMSELAQSNGNDFIKTFNTVAEPLIEQASSEFKNLPGSRFVKLYEIFQRPTRAERKKGENGKVLLLTNEQTKPLRVSSWPYKAEGWPAHILQFNEVTDSMFGLSDIETYASIADQKNIIVNQQLRNAKQTNKVWIFYNKSGNNEEDVQKAQEGDNTFIGIEGDGKPISQQVSVASAAGGTSSELYLLDQRIDRNLQDKSGVNDLKKGFLQSGEESAESVKLRAAGGSARPSYRQDIMADFLRDSAHFLNQLNKQFMTVNEAVRIIGSLDVEWSDNPTKQEIQADTDVEIDVISMLPENPEEELKRFQLALGMAIDGVRDPVVRQKLNIENKTVELAPLIEQILMRLRIRDPQVFRNIKPEESQGFVSVAEVRSAKANIESALQGNEQVPSPPAPGQDHLARIETYTSILNVIKSLGESIASTILQNLVMMHQQLLEEEQKKEAQPGRPVSIPKQEFGIRSATLNGR